MILKYVFILLLSVGTLSAQTQINTSRPYKAVISKTACAKSEKSAIIKVDVLLEKIVGIPSKHLYTKNVYIRKSKNSRGAYCVEGVVTKAGFKLYDKQLQAQYEEIMGEIEDLNDGISYANKPKEVTRLYQSVVRYNKKLKKAKSLSAMDAMYINETEASLSAMINAIPVVTFNVKGCKNRFKVGCKLVFVSSFEDDSSKVQYNWNFGDGKKSEHKNPIHKYKHAGKYTVSLRITDGGKKFAQVSKNIIVRAQPKSKPKVHYKPTADFSMSKNIFVDKESVSFVNLSAAKGSEIKTYAWNFGDGSHSDLKSPLHTYMKSGHYKVRLKVTNKEGLSSTAEETIDVVHPAIVFATDGRKYNRVVRKFGQAKKAIIKKGVLTKAYQYGNDWLLVKQNKVECRIKGSEFKTNLMGNPKNCRWYEKHVKSGMYNLQ